jgi:hypothetical protein
MSIESEFKLISKNYKDQQGRLHHNETLFNIYEGSLLKYVLEDLRRQLSQQSYEQMIHRVAPINLLNRVVDKLSRIYSKPVQRIIVNGTDADQDLFSWYEYEMRPNVQMPIANKFFNMFKDCLVEPYLNAYGRPRLRIIPSDRFFVLGEDPVDPMSVTHCVKIMGKQKDLTGLERMVLYVYTNEYFAKIDSEGKLLEPILENPYGTIPYVHIVRSRHHLTPISDSDTLTMTKLFPVLLSDLNFAVMFQTFSILYGIDVDEENLKFSPNAFWRFKSDPTSQNKPEIGMIKPEVDSDKVMALIQAQLAMWLNSRNIRPGSVGSLNTENFASGISKMVDEMDTSEDRQQQIPYFKEAEEELWYKLMHHIHPVWASNPDYERKESFTPASQIEVLFPEQLPMQDRASVVSVTIQELNSGLVDKETAIRRINPDSTQNEIDQLMSKINEQESVEIDG